MANQEKGSEYELLNEVGDNIWLCKAPIDVLREQDINARTMPNEMFLQLAQNIGDRKTLEALPFCAETNNGIEIISGHHRVRAARHAGLTTIYFLLDRSGLSRDQIAAKQLAHNSISGIDDPQIVGRIYQSIKDANTRIAAYIDPTDLDIKIEPVQLPIIDTEIDFRQITFLFLSHQLDKFDEVTNTIQKNTDMIGIADLTQYDKLKTAIHLVRETEDIRAVGMIISRMCDIVQEYYNE